jgi:replicative DNA helicase
MNRPEPEDEVGRLRVPPHSVEAEQSVLGALMLDNGAWDRVGDMLADKDFYRHEHKLIYAAISGLVSASKPADVITVLEKLQGLGKAEAVGGLVYLNALAQSVPSAANARRYAEIVRQKAVLREIISAANETAAKAFNADVDAGEVLADAQGRLLAISEHGMRAKGGPQGMDTLVVALLDRVQDMADKGGQDVTGTPTGFVDLDQKVGGLEAGDLVIIAARSSMGKTSLALNIAEHIALKEVLPVLVFSMEMGAAQLALRIVGSVGRIWNSQLRTGRLDDVGWSKLTDAFEKLRLSNIHVDETPALTKEELRLRARRHARDVGKLGLIVIDYLQLMSGSGGGDERRSAELGEITRSLKGLGKELGCPVIALSQINRGVESRTDKRPVMSDLKESGSIEEDADVVMLIYRDDYYNKDSREPGVAEINVAKARNGPTGVVKLGWLAPMTKFVNLAADYQPPQAAPSAPRKAL